MTNPSENKKLSSKEIRKMIKESPEAAFYGRRFVTAEYGQVMPIGKDSKGFMGRIGIAFYLKSAGIKFSDARQIFSDRINVDGKLKEVYAESWEKLGDFHGDDMPRWRKLAEILDKTVHYYVDVSNGTGCEYSKVATFYPPAKY